MLSHFLGGYGLHVASFGDFTDETVHLHSDPFDTTVLNGAGLRALINLKSANIALERAKALSASIAKATFAASERSAEAQQAAQATGYVGSMRPQEGQQEVGALYTKKATMMARSRTMGAASDAPRVARIIADAQKEADIAVRTVAAATGMKSGLKPVADTIPGFTDGALLGIPGVNVVTKVHAPNEPFVPADVGLPPVALDMPYSLGMGTDPYVPFIRGGKFMMDPYRMEGQQKGADVVHAPHFIQPVGGPSDIVTNIIQKLTQPNVVKPYVPGQGTPNNPGALDEGQEEHPPGEPLPEEEETYPEPGTTQVDLEPPQEPAPDKHPEGEEGENEQVLEKDNI